MILLVYWNILNMVDLGENDCFTDIDHITWKDTKMYLLKMNTNKRLIR